MGYQHSGENGQWPHLDQLYAHNNIDVVSFDNYLPLSDWTTGDGGLDAQNWLTPAPRRPGRRAKATFNGLGLTGQPSLRSIPYLKANIEGGQPFNWFYNDSNNLGIGFDPNGTDLRVSTPQGDRLAQSRNAYAANQQLLANKQLRWWWNNQHQAIYAWRLGAARTVHRVGAELEADHLCRIRLSGLRQGDQSAERLLRSKFDRERHAILVHLGPKRECRRKLLAAAG